jgi:hypothetical protein
LSVHEKEAEEKDKPPQCEESGRKLVSESRQRYVGEQFGSQPTWERPGSTKQAGTVTLLWLCISRLIAGDESY